MKLIQKWKNGYNNTNVIFTTRTVGTTKMVTTAIQLMVKKWYVQYELKLQFVFQTQREEETKKSGVSEFDG